MVAQQAGKADRSPLGCSGLVFRYVKKKETKIETKISR